MSDTKILKIVLVAVVLVSSVLIGFSQYRYHNLVTAISNSRVNVQDYSRSASANGGGVIPNSIGKSLLDESGPVSSGPTGTCMVIVTDYTTSPPRVTCAHYSN